MSLLLQMTHMDVFPSIIPLSTAEFTDITDDGIQGGGGGGGGIPETTKI